MNKQTEEIQLVIEKLEQMKSELKDLGFDLLNCGELKQPDSIPIGEAFPFDYELYWKDSLDPKVRSLHGLSVHVEKVIERFKK